MYKFSPAVSPSLLKLNVKFVWDTVCDQAFKVLKTKLIEPPTLQFPKFNEQFILTTDASQNSLGAVLSQGTIGKDLPIAYASRALTKPEKNYSTIEREMLAIVYGVLHFRPYVYGKKFLIVTDHKPILYMFSLKNPSSRLMRFRLKLEEFDFEVMYKPGRFNSNADALSRINSINSTKNEYAEYIKTIELNTIINNNIIDTDLDIANSSEKLNVIYFTDRNLQSDIIEYFNSKPELLVQNPEKQNLVYLKTDDNYYVYLLNNTGYGFGKIRIRRYILLLTKIKGPVRWF